RLGARRRRRAHRRPRCPPSDEDARRRPRARPHRHPGRVPPLAAPAHGRRRRDALERRTAQRDLDRAVTRPRPRRPAMLDQAAAEALPGGIDPADLPEVAHTTAAAIVHRARALDDPELVGRLVRLVESEGLDVVASLWADAGPHSLPGALWRLYSLREWVRRDPGTLASRYLTG